MTTVLLVDDEPAVRRIIGRDLTGQPYHLISAADAGEAIEILESRAVSVLVTDERMPWVRGHQLLDIVRERFPATACILMVTGVDRDIALAAVDEGRAYGYITKPWEFRELRLAIQGALDLARLRGECARLRGECACLRGAVRDLRQRLVCDLESPMAAGLAALSCTLGGPDRSPLHPMDDILARVRHWIDRLPNDADGGEPARCDAGRIVSDAVGVVGEFAGRRSVGLIVDAEPAPALAEPADVMRAVTRALVSAVERSPEAGEVRVTVAHEPDDDAVIIEISDDAGDKPDLFPSGVPMEIALRPAGGWRVRLRLASAMAAEETNPPDLSAPPEPEAFRDSDPDVERPLLQ